MDADIIIVGAGAAGLALADHLTRTPGGPSVLLIEPPAGPVTSPPRTWCFWGPAPDGLQQTVAASWTRMLIRDPGNKATRFVCPQGYRMIRSHEHAAAMATRLAGRPRLARLTATVTTADDTPGGARVIGRDTRDMLVRAHAGMVFDSRPPRPLPPARTTLLQHFTGWFIETPADVFAPGVAELMDLRTPQPPCGLSFAYVLPLGRRRALVEYTEFSPDLLDEAGYEAALTGYLREIRGVGEWEVTGTEHGVIPMTDAVFPRRSGRFVFRIGTAGGATRPATGYTFAAIQRHSAAIAAACRAGRTPVPPRPYSRRHRAMDAAFLRALDTGRLDGAAFFADLFRRNPTQAVLRFLDGRTTLREEMAIGLRSPVWAMSRSLAELPFLPRRPHALPGEAAARETTRRKATA